VLTPTRADYVRAALLDEHELGLRAGDALHLAIALNEASTPSTRWTGCFWRRPEAEIKTARPL